jgi:hypothetical protein
VRTCLVLIFLTGCSLYPDAPSPPPGPTGGEVTTPPPPPSGRGPVTIIRCEDGDLREVHVGDFQADQPGHGVGDLMGSCAGECRSAAYLCPHGNCDGAEMALCEAPPSSGTACSLEGTACSDPTPVDCPLTACGYAAAGSSCVCSGGVFVCAGRGPAATIQQQIVGKWQGIVHPPASSSYHVSLWIYPDGTYWAECENANCIAFYYGGDGPYPDRTISILGASSTEGAWANIGIFFQWVVNPVSIGAIQSLTVNDTTLRFSFNAAWLDCTQPFLFDLTRVP